MHVSQITMGAITAERTRRLITKTGRTLAGQPLWSPDEIAILRARQHELTYKQLALLLPGRTCKAIERKAHKMNLCKKRHVWTAAEIARLRRIYPGGSREEIAAAFPGYSRRHLVTVANYHKIYRRRRRYKETGILIVDQIRLRAFELGYSMSDVDELANGRDYFSRARWHPSGWINYPAIGRAVAALAGTMSIDWH